MLKKWFEKVLDSTLFAAIVWFGPSIVLAALLAWFGALVIPPAFGKGLLEAAMGVTMIVVLPVFWFALSVMWWQHLDYMPNV